MNHRRIQAWMRLLLGWLILFDVFAFLGEPAAFVVLSFVGLGAVLVFNNTINLICDL